MQRRSLWTEANYYQLDTLADEVSKHQHTLGWLERVGGVGGLVGSTTKLVRAVQLLAVGLGIGASWYVTRSNNTDKDDTADGSDSGKSTSVELADAIIKGSKSVEAAAEVATKLTGR